jgi:manganese/zinc/iron transport system substrate-binding protein
MSRLRLVVAALLLTGFLPSGCGDSASTDSPGSSGSAPLKITTTVGMVTDIVKRVAGDKAEVEGIIGQGVDPHLYKPTRNDVAALMSADVVFYSGLLLEGKMADVLAKVGKRGKRVFAVTALIDEGYLLRPEGAAGHPDPHV